MGYRAGYYEGYVGTQFFRVLLDGNKARAEHARLVRQQRLVRLVPIRFWYAGDD